MIQAPPQEKHWISWLYVTIWSLVIFITIPFARTIVLFVIRDFGRTTFVYLVIGLVTTTFIASLTYVRRQNLKTRSSLLWLSVIAIIFIGYTIHLRKVPVEAVHFLEYGILGFLLFRALAHQTHDYSIYFTAAIIGFLIGTIDESIQWLVPGRYWQLSDIWINVLAVSLVQVGIAKGFRPAFISGPLNCRSLNLMCRFALIAAILMGLSLFNTPVRVVWYAERIPLLAFLKHNDNFMLEYGYLYKDPEIGTFRSRFSPEELKQADGIRAREAAKIIDRYRDRGGYWAFLSLYTPATDPFLHEVRVHLWRRDYYYQNALKNENDQDINVKDITIAFRENQILEKYFSETLSHSSYKWTEEMSVWAQKKHIPDLKYDSPVSGNLITRFTEFHVGCFIFAFITSLTLLQFYFTFQCKHKGNKRIGEE
jgi:VanZ family protein